jgi:hypothetical protein
MANTTKALIIHLILILLPKLTLGFYFDGPQLIGLLRNIVALAVLVMHSQITSINLRIINMNHNSLEFARLRFLQLSIL